EVLAGGGRFPHLDGAVEARRGEERSVREESAGRDRLRVRRERVQRECLVRRRRKYDKPSVGEAEKGALILRVEGSGGGLLCYGEHGLLATLTGRGGGECQGEEGNADGHVRPPRNAKCPSSAERHGGRSLQRDDRRTPGQAPAERDQDDGVPR